MFVTNCISTTKIQKISEITNFFRHYFLSRTEVRDSLFTILCKIEKQMFDAWGISIFVGFDFHNVNALRLKSRKELLTLLFRKLLILRIYSILFDGIKKLPAEHVEMEKELLLRWMAESQMLEKANVRLNDAAIQVSEWFRKKGFRTCILKGQGNALMYPNPYSRTPGDIDI